MAPPQRAFRSLFEPIKLGPLELKNRIVMPAIELGYCPDGLITPNILLFYAERAKGGAGLIIVGGAYVHSLGKSRRNLIAIDDDRCIPGLAELAKVIKSHGSAAAIQLFHGGKYAPSSIIGAQPVSASAIFSRLTGEMPRELTRAEIAEIAWCFARAAQRAKEAGFDAVEFHCCSGYLIREFLSPSTNKRGDNYGGDLAGRMRFLLQIIAYAKELVGDDSPLICRISADEYQKDGNGPAEAQQIASQLERGGLSAISVTVGGHETPIPLTQGIVPQGAFALYARMIKDCLSTPVIASGRIASAQVAERIISSGQADMVAMARAMIADPHMPEKAKSGRIDEIRPCIACGQGCFDNMFRDSPVRCLVNPEAGREAEMRLEPAARKKKVAVIGGGPAGLEAARVAAIRGHKVELYERNERVGGQLILSSKAPGKAEFAKLAAYYENELKRLGVKVNLGHEATVDSIEDAKPDCIIIAAGSRPAAHELQGDGGLLILDAFEVLSGKAQVKGKVAIIGGGGVGCEVALYLAARYDIEPGIMDFLSRWGALKPQDVVSFRRSRADIAIIELLPRVGQDIGISQRWLTKRMLEDYGIEIILGAEVRGVEGKNLICETSRGLLKVPADTVIVACGSTSEDGLFQKLSGRLPEIHRAGDCLRPRKAIDAILEGAIIAREI